MSIWKVSSWRTVVLLAACAFILNVPVLILLAVSVAGDRIMSGGDWFEAIKHGEEYRRSLWSVWNTVAVCLPATVLATSAAFVIAYLITRSQMLLRHRRLVSAVKFGCLFLYLTPAIALAPPAVAWFSELKRQFPAVDSYWGRVGYVIVANAVFCWPFSLWFSLGFLRRVRIDLEAYSSLEGASFPQVLWYAVWPRVRRGMAAVALFTFVICANDFIFASHFLGEEGMQPMTVAINKAYDSDSRHWQKIMSSAALLQLCLVVTAYVCIRGIGNERRRSSSA